MIFHVGERKFCVYWKHNVGSSSTRHNGWTECYIKEYDGPILVSESAQCSKKDQYNKRIGRDVSFGRASILFSQEFYQTDQRYAESLKEAPNYLEEQRFKAWEWAKLNASNLRERLMQEYRNRRKDAQVVY